MNPPPRSHETRETPITREVFDTTDFSELYQLIDSLLKEFPFVDVTIESEKNQATGHDSMCIDPTKRLSEPFFLKKILLENSSDDDNSELTTLALSVHAVMLESGFVLFDPVSYDDKFSFSKELLSVSLRYTLPELAESVTVTFQSLGDQVVVYGSLDGNVRRVCLDKRSFMDILKSDEEGSYREEVFVFWRMVKDGLVTPLLIGLCDKSGLELPPCFTRLPTELKVKIVASLPGASLAKMACVCREIRCLASGNDLWKQKVWEEARHLLLGNGGRGSVDWKAKFACFWTHHQKKLWTTRTRNLNGRCHGHAYIPSHSFSSGR
ncbi:hypothetical protein Bca4012_055069 [Brassica carinata]